MVRDAVASADGTTAQLTALVEAFTAFHGRDPSLALLSMGTDVARWLRDDGRWSTEQIDAHDGRLALRLGRARWAGRRVSVTSYAVLVGT